VPVGKHTFSVQLNGKRPKPKSEKLVIDVKQGETYYIELVFQDSFLIPNIYCIEITENSAMRILPGLKHAKNCKE
jgi:hypothetical protein